MQAPPSRRRLARLSLALVVIVSLAALVAAALAPSWLPDDVDAGHGGRWLGPVLALLAALATCDRVAWWQPPRHSGDEDVPAKGGTYADVGAVFVVVGLLLLGPLGAVTVGIPARVVEAARVRARPLRHLGSAATSVVAGGSGWLAFHLALRAAGVGGTDVARPAWLVAAGVAAIAFELVEITGCAVARWAVLGIATPLRELSRLHPVWTETAAGALGVLVALLWSVHPWLTVTAVWPLLVLRRALHLRDLQVASRTDLKTGLANYGWFREVAEKEVRRAVRTDAALSLLVVDLDHLRELNTAHGHLAGDVVLTGVAQVLDRGVREFDLVCRFGGEEFVVLLPSTGLAEASTIAERLRRTVDEQAFHAATAPVPLTATISVGVSLLGDHGASLEELLHAADIAVYRAKATGRNQVCVAGGPPATPRDVDALT